MADKHFDSEKVYPFFPHTNNGKGTIHMHGLRQISIHRTQVPTWFTMQLRKFVITHYICLNVYMDEYFKISGSQTSFYKIWGVREGKVFLGCYLYGGHLSLRKKGGFVCIICLDTP